MADFNNLTYFHLQGLYNAIIGDTAGSFGDPGSEPDIFNVNMAATITYYLVGSDNRLINPPPQLLLTAATPPRTLLLVPVKVEVTSGVLVVPGAQNGVTGVDLVARSPILNIPEGDLFVAKVDFGPASIGGGIFQFDPVIFTIPTVALAAYTANNIQILTIDPTATGGTWEAVYHQTPTTVMSPSVTAATMQGYLNTAIQDALNLPNTASCVTVALVSAGVFRVTFNNAIIPRPLALGTLSNLTGAAGTTPQVAVADTYSPVVIDLTTVDQFVPTP